MSKKYITFAASFGNTQQRKVISKTKRTMDTTPRWQQKLESYHKALSRLAEIVNVAKTRSLNDIERDGMIQRFEFTHELAWKVMMSFCKFQSPEESLYGSKDSTRWAYERGLITNGEVWMQMIASRNYTSHNYDDSEAAETARAIVCDFYPELVAFWEKMQSISANPQGTLF